jgi:hypothetical protein
MNRLVVLIVFLVATLTYGTEELSLHTRACMGLPFNAIHLHGYCVMNLDNKATCEEVQYFFQRLDLEYKKRQFEDLPPLVISRLTQEEVIGHAKHREMLCINFEEVPTENNCPPNFYEFRENCYVATR